MIWFYELIGRISWLFIRKDHRKHLDDIPWDEFDWDKNIARRMFSWSWRKEVGRPGDRDPSK
jgi:hypothetical protein